MNIDDTEVLKSTSGNSDSFVDIEVMDGVVARLRPTAQASTYEIRVGGLRHGVFMSEIEPFEATFGREFDAAVAALES